MKPPKIVVDTNVLVTALRSRRGAVFRLLTLVGRGHFEIAVSVPLILEYEAAAKRLPRTGLTARDRDDTLDYLCSVADRRAVFFLWRPYLKDSKDDLSWSWQSRRSAGTSSLTTSETSPVPSASGFAL